MDKYTPITTHAELVEALRLGLTVEANAKGNESAKDYQRSEPSGWLPGLDAPRRAVVHADAFDREGFAFRAVGEHDLSAPAKPAPLTNADLNPGDIVHGYGKEWRVQGIDDNAPSSGLLLVDTAEPEDADDFTEAAFGVTRGIGRRPRGDARWCWGYAGHVELVSRGEPTPVEPEFTAEGPLAVGDLVRVARDWTGFGVHGPVDRARFLGMVGRIAEDDREIDGTLGLSAPDGSPLNVDGVHGLLWVHAAQLDRVEGEEDSAPEPEEVEPFASLPDDFTGFDTPPAFRVSIILEAESAEGLQAAIDAITGLQS